MDIQTLIFFKTVAKCGSFSAASHELRYAQSNISTKIQQLESDMQTTLFYRHNRGVTLTHKGELFLQYTDEILNLLHKTKTAMKDDGVANGRLSIGSLETIAQVYLPSLLATYHRDNPQVNLSISTGNSVELTNSVLDRTLDGAFISGPVNHPDLKYIEFETEKLLLATAATNNTFSSCKDLENKTLLVFQYGCYYRHLLEQLLQEKGIIPNQIVEFDSIGAIISSLCAGFGISLLPESILSQYEKSNMLTTFNIPVRYSSVPTYFIYRKDYYTTTAFLQFIDCLNN